MGRLLGRGEQVPPHPLAAVVRPPGLGPEDGRRLLYAWMAQMELGVDSGGLLNEVISYGNPPVKYVRELMGL